MKYIRRHTEDTVLTMSRSFPAILLTGPRQSGKTTMLRELAKAEDKGRKFH